MEMTLKNLTNKGEIDHQDFLDRVDILRTLGKTVLISNYGEYYRLAGYLFRYTKERVAMVMGVPSLKEIFDEKYYSDLEGGILESLGRLFKNDLKRYVYPLRAKPGPAVDHRRNASSRAPSQRPLRLSVEESLHRMYSRISGRLSADFLARRSGETPGGRCRLGKNGAITGGADDQTTQALWISPPKPSFRRQKA